MNLKYKNISKFDPKLYPGEKNTLPSLTIPGQALTPRELLLNFVKGGQLPPERQVTYENGGFDDDDPTRRPDFELADYTEEERRLILKGAEQRLAKEQEKARLEQLKTTKTGDLGKQTDGERSGGSAADDQSDQAGSASQKSPIELRGANPPNKGKSEQE